MARNKVVLGNEVLIDLTSDTVTPSTLFEGYTAHDRSGNLITGTAEPTSILIEDTTDSHGGIIRNITGKVVKLQTKTITPTSSVQNVSPDTGYDGFSSVTVEAESGTTINNQNKSVSPTESQQTVTADNGYTGLGTVTVGAINSTYVGSGVARKSSTDLTVSGSTVTAPAGYYSSAASKSIPGGSATPASTISGTSATVTTGTNTITLSKSVSNTPSVTAGYISNGTTGNSSVSLTASVTTKGAATITPGTSNQTIASGTYLTGMQTISGDSNLIADNIKKGTTIFGVAGNYEGGGASKNVQISNTPGRATSTTYTAVGPSITVSKTGTYDVYWTGYRSSTSGTNGSQLYIGSTAYGSAQTSFITTTGLTNIQEVHLTNVSLTANQVLTIRARSRGNNYYMYIQDLIIIEQ